MNKHICFEKEESKLWNNDFGFSFLRKIEILAAPKMEERALDSWNGFVVYVF